MSTTSSAVPNQALDLKDSPQDSPQGLGSSRSSVTSRSPSDDMNIMMEEKLELSDTNAGLSIENHSDSDATEYGDPSQAEGPSSLPPPPRRKSGILVSLPADDKGPSTSEKSSTKKHSRTNTFGAPVADVLEDHSKARKGSNLRSVDSATETEQ